MEAVVPQVNETCPLGGAREHQSVCEKLLKADFINKPGTYRQIDIDIRSACGKEILICGVF